MKYKITKLTSFDRIFIFLFSFFIFVQMELGELSLFGMLCFGIVFIFLPIFIEAVEFENQKGKFEENE